jgi:hypothetical protein
LSRIKFLKTFSIAKEVTGKEVTGKEVTAKEVTAKEVTGKEVTAKEVTAKEVTAKEVTAKEVTGKDWFKLCMKRLSHKLSLLQPTGTSTARAIGFSKEQAGIFFDLNENELAAHDCPPSLIFNLDENVR